MQVSQPIQPARRSTPGALEGLLRLAHGQEPKASAAYVLPTPDVSESTWADWVAAEAALAN